MLRLRLPRAIVTALLLVGCAEEVAMTGTISPDVFFSAARIASVTRCFSSDDSS